MTRRTSVTAAGLAATVIEPADPNGVVMFCLAGGGMSRHYFDLPGADEAGTLSMSEHLAGSRYTVITLDHPGVGDSPPGVDGWELTPHFVAERDAAAIAELRRHYPGIAIGIGHSMGAMLSVIAQGRHYCFDALALLGWSFSQRFGLPELDAGLTDAERAVLGNADAVRAHQVEFAKQKFAGPRHDGNSTTWEFLIGPTQISDQARQAIRHASAELLAVCGLAAVLRGVGPEVAAIDVPVLLAWGQHDVTGNARATAEELRNCPDLTLFELPDAGHNHNVAPNRAALWNRIVRWTDSVTAATPGDYAAATTP